jgi:Ser/Thr protein kinase RdoA (MazF antagonist)
MILLPRSEEEISSLNTIANFFPVVYSTLSPQALTDLVLAEYAIEETIACQLWHRGLSDVYLIDTPTKQYILRVSHHHWRSKSEIDFELELLDFYQQRQLPVASPLRTIEDRLSVEINAPEGKRYAALFEYAPGEVPIGDLNLTQSHSLGKTLAKLHQASQDFHSQSKRQSLTLEYLLDDSLTKIVPFLKHRKEDYKYLQETIEQIEFQLQDFTQEYPFWGVCWGDPHSGNVHFTKDNRLTLFDFDQCGYGWRIFDIAKFVHISLRTGISKNIREAFVSGYQEISKLSDREISSLQAFTQTAHIWVWAININYACLHNYSRLDDLYICRWLEQLKRLRSKDWQLF